MARRIPTPFVSFSHTLNIRLTRDAIAGLVEAILTYLPEDNKQLNSLIDAQRLLDTGEAGGIIAKGMTAHQAREFCALVVKTTPSSVDTFLKITDIDADEEIHLYFDEIEFEDTDKLIAWLQKNCAPQIAAVIARAAATKTANDEYASQDASKQLRADIRKLEKLGYQVRLIKKSK